MNFTVETAKKRNRQKMNPSLSKCIRNVWWKTLENDSKFSQKWVNLHQKHQQLIQKWINVCCRLTAQAKHQPRQPRKTRWSKTKLSLTASTFTWASPIFQKVEKCPFSLIDETCQSYSSSKDGPNRSWNLRPYHLENSNNITLYRLTPPVSTASPASPPGSSTNFTLSSAHLYFFAIYLPHQLFSANLRSSISFSSYLLPCPFSSFSDPLRPPHLCVPPSLHLLLLLHSHSSFSVPSIYGGQSPQHNGSILLPTNRISQFL